MVEEKKKVQEADGGVEEVPTPEERIVLSDDSSDEDDISQEEHLRKLFVGGLTGQTSEDRLRTFYGKWGSVVDVVVMRDSDTKRSRGFGFVTYSKVSMVNKAQANRPHIIDGKKVESKRALPRPDYKPKEITKNYSVKKLFVGALKDVHDEENLQEYFSEFGNVVSVDILKDNITGKRRGFALVEYDDYDAVDQAILQKTHVVCNTLLDVKKSIYTKDDPKKFFEKKKEKSEDTKRIITGQNGKFVPPRGNENRRAGAHPMRSQKAPYQGPPAPQQYGQQPYPSSMNSYPNGPPANNPRWGPPPPPTQHAQAAYPYAQPPNAYPHSCPTPMPQQQPQPPPQMPTQNYGGYSQATMPPPVQAPPVQQSAPQPPVQPAGNWGNYQPAGGNNLWNPPPPPQPPQPPISAQAPPTNWPNQNQWGPTHPASASGAPPQAMPPANQAPPMNWQQPPAQHAGPPQTHNAAPGMYQQQQNHQSAPPPHAPGPNNFGTGYQQNYGGGPAKPSSTHANRMNPYNSGPVNQYNNNPPAQGGYDNTNGTRHRR